MSRTHRPILDAAAGNVLAMIALHQDRPCPTNAEIREWTGVPRRRVASFVAALVARGIIEVEFEPASGRPRRRMRAVGGVWTGWTLRGRTPARARPAAATVRLLALIERRRDRPCPTVCEIADRIGISRAHVAPFLADLVARGVIEIEGGERTGALRRMRAGGGAWTGWTRGFAPR